MTDATERTSATLRTAILAALHTALKGTEVAPATLTAAIGYLKAFPPKDEDDLSKAKEISDRLKGYGAKVTSIHQR